jgi:hypothetical protein
MIHLNNINEIQSDIIKKLSSEVVDSKVKLILAKTLKSILNYNNNHHHIVSFPLFVNNILDLFHCNQFDFEVKNELVLVLSQWINQHHNSLNMFKNNRKSLNHQHQHQHIEKSIDENYINMLAFSLLEKYQKECVLGELLIINTSSVSVNYSRDDDYDADSSNEGIDYQLIQKNFSNCIPLYYYKKNHKLTFIPMNLNSEIWMVLSLFYETNKKIHYIYLKNSSTKKNISKEYIDKIETTLKLYLSKGKDNINIVFEYHNNDEQLNDWLGVFEYHNENKGDDIIDNDDNDDDAEVYYMLKDLECLAINLSSSSIPKLFNMFQFVKKEKNDIRIFKTIQLQELFKKQMINFNHYDYYKYCICLNHNNEKIDLSTKLASKLSFDFEIDIT